MKSIEIMEGIINHYGSRYPAIHRVADKARELKESCYNVILDSQAVEWAITGVPPANLEEAIRARVQSEEGASQEDRLTTILDSIAEDDIRIAVRNSYNLSTKNKQIAFDYNGIKDRGTRTRIRILTKLAFIG